MLAIQSLNTVIGWPFKGLINQPELLSNLLTLYPFFHLLYFISAIRTLKIMGNTSPASFMLCSDPVYARFKTHAAANSIGEIAQQDENKESEELNNFQTTTDNTWQVSDNHFSTEDSEPEMVSNADPDLSSDNYPLEQTVDEMILLPESEPVNSRPVEIMVEKEQTEDVKQNIPALKSKIPVINVYRPRFNSSIPEATIIEKKAEKVRDKSPFVLWLRQVSKADENILTDSDLPVKKKKKKKKKSKKHDFNKTIIDSLIDHDYLVSEQYGDLLYQQGYLDKAIAIFERLMVEKPEKSTIFAAKIDQIKKDKI